MNTVQSIAAIVALTFGATAGAWADGEPCKPISDACKAKGYYEGGQMKHMGLIKDCVMPVASGQMKLDGMPAMQPEDMKSCQAEIMAKMPSMMAAPAAK